MSLAACGGPIQQAAAPSSSSAPSSPAPSTHTITAVPSGDTVVLDGAQQIRLFGIVAPEFTTPCGPEAQGFLDRYRGTRVRPDPGEGTPDQSGAVLANLITEDGRDLGLELARNGWATFDGAGGAASRAAAVNDAVRAAKAAALGQWSPTGCAARTTTEAPVATVEPPPAEEPEPETTVEEPDTYVPDTPDIPEPRTPKKHHTGNTGHPCLPGERDGDGDGYCGEGKH
ncbi:thermonuclease family protein [Sciscionella sediminilitoris]|uniref:thermonuclease family protein n=1 Tax=Sciscionella sediminilitoris TaxID=1445613 RepID=UPI0006EB4B6C|nr:thermonuclease family protein [Sciscionella sp. SE31]